MLFRHLMLLFNQRVEYTLSNILSFQNISCYCLTQNTDLYKDYAVLFQNISCYCLTQLWFDGIKDLLEFQNISCYCLTQACWKSDSRPFLFQNISCYCLTDFLYFFVGSKIISKHLLLLFNLCRRNPEREQNNISKHLLLLFNRFSQNMKSRD